MSDNNFLNQDDIQREEASATKERPLWIKILALSLAIVIIVGSIFIIRGCVAVPKIEEIRERVDKLLDSAYEVNVVLYGEGLATYERIYDPMDSLKYYNTGEFTVGTENRERRVAYYYTIQESEDVEVVAFRNSHEYKEKYAYAYVSKTELSEMELKALFPEISGVEPKEGQSFYSEVFRSADGSDICYLVPYVEKEYEFYYTEATPKNYDYVRKDALCSSINDIKNLARTVYSEKYVESISGTLFDGVASGDTVLLARYVEDESGLMQHNGYEPFFTEKKVYLVDTAEVIKWGSGSDKVRIKINSYLPSNPKEIFEEEIQIEKENGQWFLANPAF